MGRDSKEGIKGIFSKTLQSFGLKTSASQKKNLIAQEIETLKKSPVFCANPFVHVSSTPRGTLRPCCYFTEPLREDNGEVFNVGEGSLKKIWNGKHLREIRKKMLSGESMVGCMQCYNEEEAQGGSMRTRSFEEWLGEDRLDIKEEILESKNNNFEVKTTPRYLELKPGNICNLKCRMCNKHDSNQIEKELEELSEKYQAPEILHGSAYLMEDPFDQEIKNLSSVDWMKNEKFWEEVSEFLPSVETLSFAGGEPSLLPSVHKFLKDCVEQGYSKNITVFMATNFMKMNKNLLDVSTQFKMFEFIASIDGVGGIQEYIRTPSEWSTIEKNFREVKKRMNPHSTKILVNSTIQMNNVLHFTDLVSWLEELDREKPRFFHHPFNLNILHFPNHLYIGHLPPRGRQIAIERIEKFLKSSQFIKKFPDLEGRFNQIISLLKQPMGRDSLRQLKLFWHFTHVMDEHRNQSLEKVDPLLYEIVKEELESHNMNVNDLITREGIKNEAFLPN